MSDAEKCYKCNRKSMVQGGCSELRPYGPKGEWICFNCAMKPENKATTEMMLSKTLDAAPVMVIDDAGIRPANDKDLALLAELDKETGQS